MMKFLLPLLFLIPLLAAPIIQDTQTPVAPPGCKWIIVGAGEMRDGSVLKAVFLVCPAEKPV